MRSTRKLLAGLGALCLQRGVPRKVLAERVALCLDTLYRYEAGRRTPKFACLQALAEALDCEIWQLFHPDPILNVAVDPI